MAMKTTVRPQPLVVLVMLYGVLGARFGRIHHLAVASGAEAIHALCVKIPGFKRFLRGFPWLSVCDEIASVDLNLVEFLTAER